MRCNICNSEMRIGNEQVGVDGNNIPIYHRFSYCDKCMFKYDLDGAGTHQHQKKKESALSICAAIFSILLCTSIIGFVLAIIDLSKNDKNEKHVGSWFAVICFFFILVHLIVSINRNDVEEIKSPSVATEYAQENENEYDNTEEDKIKQEVPQETEEDYKASCQEYNYKDVLRNPENYIGQKVKITVEISSVHEASWLYNEKYYFANSEGEYGYFSGDRYAIIDKRYDNSLKLLDEDVILVYGEIAEPEETESLIVNSEELFVIDMRYVELLAE